MGQMIKQSENLKRRYQSEVLGVDGKIITEWILEKKDGLDLCDSG
jgi:hypothetical protein